MTKDFREVLARKDIDAVMISTPDHWHTLISVLALRAGKDVQCEKPTLTLDEGKVLVTEVRKRKKVFQTSTEDRSIPVYHRMAELVRNGRIGKLQTIEVILPRQPNVPAIPRRSPCHRTWIGPVARAGARGSLHQGSRSTSTSGGSRITRADHLRLGHAPCSTRPSGPTTRAQRPGRDRGHRHVLGRRPLQHGEGLRCDVSLRERGW